jgi:hypothetical protein
VAVGDGAREVQRAVRRRVRHAELTFLQRV